MKVLTCFCLMLILLPGLCFSQNQNTNDAIKGLQKNTLLSIFDTKNAQKHFDDIQTNVNQSASRICRSHHHLPEVSPQRPAWKANSPDSSEF